MRQARDLFVARHGPDIECDGELHGDAACRTSATYWPTPP
jgi:phosphotransacetylase